jgi:hypothetical protein
MTVRELFGILNERIPRALSCDWDNDGLMCCPDGEREVKRVLIALDATGAVCDAAIDAVTLGAEVETVIFSASLASATRIDEGPSYSRAPPRMWMTGSADAGAVRSKFQREEALPVTRWVRHSMSSTRHSPR